MTLEQAIEMAARDLPPGASLSIEIEKDSAWLSAHDWDCNPWENDEFHSPFAAQIVAAVEWCKARELPAPPSAGVNTEAVSPSD